MIGGPSDNVGSARVVVAAEDGGEVFAAEEGAYDKVVDGGVY